MAGQNVSLPIIGRVLGHKTPQATMVYSRLALDPLDESGRLRKKTTGTRDKATAKIIVAGVALLAL